MSSTESPASSDRYVVATDGACKGNPGPAGWAWVGEDGTGRQGPSPRERTTSASCSVCCTPSPITPTCVNCRAGRLEVRDRHVLEVDGRPPPSRLGHEREEAGRQPGILEALIAARDARRAAGLPDVVLEHVRGHSGHVLNSWADERAVRASQHAAKGEELIWTSLRGLDKLEVSSAPPRFRSRPQRALGAEDLGLFGGGESARRGRSSPRSRSSSSVRRIVSARERRRPPDATKVASLRRAKPPAFSGSHRGSERGPAQ